MSESVLGVKVVVRVSKHRGMWRAESSRCCRPDMGDERLPSPVEEPDWHSFTELWHVA